MGMRGYNDRNALGWIATQPRMNRLSCKKKAEKQSGHDTAGM